MKNRPSSRRVRGGSRGVALIVVIWVIGLLSILLASFAFDAHVEARIVSYYRKRMKAEYLARSGIELAQMLMEKSGTVSEDDEDDTDRWLGSAKSLKKGKLVGLVEEVGEGKILLDIVPEPARRNINNLGKTDEVITENLDRILNVGDIPEEMRPELIESFLDWIDANNEPRLDGAESEDYYETLDPPYQAKNGPLDTVGELLLIRGWTRGILTGGTIKLNENDEEGVEVSGIGDLLTTYGSGKINVNAASARVLRTIPGVDELVAGAIIEEREGWADLSGKQDENPFDNADDLMSRLPDLNPSIREYIETSSSIYRITSAGEVHGVKREIWCIAGYDSTKKDLKIKRWREQD